MHTHARTHTGGVALTVSHLHGNAIIRPRCHAGVADSVPRQQVYLKTKKSEEEWSTFSASSFPLWLKYIYFQTPQGV